MESGYGDALTLCDGEGLKRRGWDQGKRQAARSKCQLKVDLWSSLQSVVCTTSEVVTHDRYAHMLYRKDHFPVLQCNMVLSTRYKYRI